MNHKKEQNNMANSYTDREIVFANSDQIEQGTSEGKGSNSLEGEKPATQINFDEQSSQKKLSDFPEAEVTISQVNSDGAGSQILHQKWGIQTDDVSYQSSVSQSFCKKKEFSAYESLMKARNEIRKKGLDESRRRYLENYLEGFQEGYLEGLQTAIDNFPQLTEDEASRTPPVVLQNLQNYLNHLHKKKRQMTSKYESKKGVKQIVNVRKSFPGARSLAFWY